MTRINSESIKSNEVEEQDLKLLWMFTLRIGMYTGRENQDTVLSFLHGYEIGRNNECDYLAQLSRSIETEYGLASKAKGWIGQIEDLAEKLEMDWITAFKKQSIQLLVSRFTESIWAEFEESYRRRINGKMRGVPDYFQRNWVTDWFGIVDLKADWTKRIWSSSELELLRAIDVELLSYGKIRDITGPIEPTDKLQHLCAMMLAEMNKQNRESP